MGRLTLIRERSQSLSTFFGTIAELSRAAAPRPRSPWMSSFTTFFFLSLSSSRAASAAFLSGIPMLLSCSVPPSSALTTCTKEALKFRFLMLDGLMTSCVVACLRRRLESLVSLWPKGRRKAGWMKCSGLGLAV